MYRDPAPSLLHTIARLEAELEIARARSSRPAWGLAGLSVVFVLAGIAACAQAASVEADLRAMRADEALMHRQLTYCAADREAMQGQMRECDGELSFCRSIATSHAAPH